MVTLVIFLGSHPTFLPFDYLTVAMEMAHLHMMKMMMYLLQNMILLFANRNK